MKIKEIRELSVAELGARRREIKEEVFHLRVQQQSGQLEKPSQLHTLRKEVARIETVLNQKAKSAEAAK
ncbi:MAG: ribosomal protein [Chthoniobacteraceae bacterium]|nr:ribosomal protein [Chthoniobacteraceae bacterium]MDB6170951.1 ribosomal protein [Chthoniobacteraceae bacterium]